MLRNAEITAARHKVAAVVCVKAGGMAEPWHLAVGHLEQIAIVHQRIGFAVAFDDRIFVDGDVVVVDL